MISNNPTKTTPPVSFQLPISFANEVPDPDRVIIISPPPPISLQPSCNSTKLTSISIFLSCLRYSPKSSSSSALTSHGQFTAHLTLIFSSLTSSNPTPITHNSNQPPVGPLQFIPMLNWVIQNPKNPSVLALLTLPFSPWHLQFPVQTVLQLLTLI